jgi:hypothetical protein
MEKAEATFLKLIKTLLLVVFAVQLRFDFAKIPFLSRTIFVPLEMRSFFPSSSIVPHPISGALQ